MELFNLLPPVIKEHTLNRPNLFYLRAYMSQDRYTKFILTVIAFSLFLIALNLSVTGFVLYDLYNDEMETLFSKISSRIDEISSSIDDVVEAIKKR